MRKSEAVQLRLVSSCHDLPLSHVKNEDFESTPSFVAGEVSTYSFQEASQNDVESKATSSNELEDGELIEGIEANDVSALLEQFLEYEEKQGSVDGSMALPSLKDTSYEEQTVSDKINLFVDMHELKFDFRCDVENGGLPSSSVENSVQFHSAENKENQEVNETKSCESSWDNVKGQDENSKIVKNCHVDNHATDHNYACSGFPMRKPIQLRPEDDSTLKNSALKCSPQKSLEMEKKKDFISEETGSPRSHKRRLSCSENLPDRKRKLPKRYRGRYCEESSGGESNCDEGYHYREMSTDKDRDHIRENSLRKFSYSSDGDRSYDKRSSRRHSMCSNDSYDGQEFSSSDEESKGGRRSQYYPRRSESDWRRRQPSDSDRESDHYGSPHNRRRRRRRRSRSRDSTEKRNGVRKNKMFHDIEFERKLEFKFDHNIRDTAKEERRIVYIGKISNKTTEDDVFRRFRPFGPIEKVTVHFREKGDNYAFVTFFETSSAAEAIERGNEDSRLPVLDLCFGGRRKFCGGSYVDFDSNTSYLEEQELSRPPSSDEMDFDALLRMSQKNLESRKESCKGRYMY